MFVSVTNSVFFIFYLLSIIPVCSTHIYQAKTFIKPLKNKKGKNKKKTTNKQKKDTRIKSQVKKSETPQMKKKVTFSKSVVL